MLYRSNTLDHWSHKGSVEGSRVLPQKCQFHPQSTSFGVCSTCVRVLRVLQVLTAASSTAGLLWHLVHVHRVRKKVTRVPFCLPFCKKSMYSVYREYPWCVFQFIASTRWRVFFLVGALLCAYVHTYVRYIKHPCIQQSLWPRNNSKMVMWFLSSVNDHKWEFVGN